MPLNRHRSAQLCGVIVALFDMVKILLVSVGRSTPGTVVGEVDQLFVGHVLRGDWLRLEVTNHVVVADRHALALRAILHDAVATKSLLASAWTNVRPIREIDQPTAAENTAALLLLCKGLIERVGAVVGISVSLRTDATITGTALIAAGLCAVGRIVLNVFFIARQHSDTGGINLL